MDDAGLLACKDAGLEGLAKLATVIKEHPDVFDEHDGTLVLNYYQSKGIQFIRAEQIRSRAKRRIDLLDPIVTKFSLGACMPELIGELAKRTSDMMKEAEAINGVSGTGPGSV